MKHFFTISLFAMMLAVVACKKDDTTGSSSTASGTTGDINSGSSGNGNPTGAKLPKTETVTLISDGSVVDVINYYYDSNSYLVLKTTKDTIFAYTYDGSLLKKVTKLDATNTATVLATKEFTYDSQKRLVNLTEGSTIVTVTAYDDKGGIAMYEYRKEFFPSAIYTISHTVTNLYDKSYLYGAYGWSVGNVVRYNKASSDNAGYEDKSLAYDPTKHSPYEAFWGREFPLNNARKFLVVALRESSYAPEQTGTWKFNTTERIYLYTEFNSDGYVTKMKYPGKNDVATQSVFSYY